MSWESYFELVCSLKINDTIPLRKFKSKRTGLTVCLGDVEGPVVSGYFCVATEAFDDDGLPHTLEHLVFLGSEQYPYKGVLDLLANRCLASGTNAWTATDHTCYTITTAGDEGFLNLLPIYLDHILYPTLTESGFITEVHHVNGDGEDGGVVYCEMQGKENTGESLAYVALSRAMYPGVCGYKSVTGGILKNLRESTTREKVHDYHKAFYRPENLCLIISGKVNELAALEAIRKYEEVILSKEPRDPFQRPWQSDVPPLTDSLTEIVRYPCDDEETGLVFLSWRGPNASELHSLTALNILLAYMTESAVSPLQRSFVELDEPYCNKVEFSVSEFKESSIYLMFENVPKSKLTEIQKRVFSVLNSFVDKTEALDMKRLQTIIKRGILEILSQIECNPHEMLAHYMISDFLYGTSVDNLNERINQIIILQELQSKDEAFWIEMLKKYFIGTPCVNICGEPSNDVMAEMMAVEMERIKNQRDSLGEDGLMLKTEQLLVAVENNEIPPPDSILTLLNVPSIESIKFHSIMRSNNHNESDANLNDKFPLSDLPFKFQLDDVSTNFVHIAAVLNTSCVPSDIKLYIPILLEVMIESPVMRNNELIDHETVIKELAEDCIRAQTSVGIGSSGKRFSCGVYAQIASLYLQVDLEKYAKGVSWIRELLFQTKFTVERLKIIAMKMINEVASLKRQGNSVAHTIVRNLCFNKESNHHMNSTFRQQKFLTNLLKNLELSPDEVLGNINKIRSILTNVDNITIHMAANMNKLSKKYSAVDPWKELFFPALLDTKCKSYSIDIQQCHQLLQSCSPTQNTAIAGLGAVESSYLVQCVPCINDFNSKDLPALMVFLKYLSQTEGPMWKQIRGNGLAYGYNMNAHSNEGLLFFYLYRSSLLVNAYKESKSIVENLINGQEACDVNLLETARSSLIFELIESEESVFDVCMQSLVNYCRNVSGDYNRKLLKEVAKITFEDLKRVGPKYVPQIFDPSVSWCSICCHSSKVEEAVEGFKQFGYDLKVVDLDDNFLTQL